MRILFVLSMRSLLRHFDTTALELAARGHQIRVATPLDRHEWPLPHACRDHPQITTVNCPGRRGDEWHDAVHLLRSLTDYLRFLDEPFLDSHDLRTRAFDTLTAAAGAQDAPAATCSACRAEIPGDHLGRTALSPVPVRRNVRDLLRLVETAVPSDPEHERFLRSEQPDVVLVTPLVGLGSLQADYVKSARALGIPVACPVFSWDNLSTKGVVHVQPDRMFVWNDVQKDEAIRLHAVPEERIVVTGAPRFDQMFGMTPGVSREEFCAAHRLDPNQPILAYLCSSELISANEVEFVHKWIDEIRREPSLATANVVVRPHPRALDPWKTVRFAKGTNVALGISKRMKSKSINIDEALFDLLYHSAAVVGLNTSAQLEAGILGKPVYTILAPDFARGQQGTVHFTYLLRETGGFVEVASDFDQHRRHLADAVAGRFDRDRIRQFMERFIRPAGWDRPATPILADAVEELALPKQSVVKRLFKSVSAGW